VDFDGRISLNNVNTLIFKTPIVSPTLSNKNHALKIPEKI
jgi:hypothetical protein